MMSCQSSKIASTASSHAGIAVGGGTDGSGGAAIPKRAKTIADPLIARFFNSRLPTASGPAAVRPGRRPRGRGRRGSPGARPARSLPVPTSTSVPTIERTIWWQNALARISNAHQRASRRRPTVQLGSTFRTGSLSDVEVDLSSPGDRSATLGRRQNDEKSCSPTKCSAAVFIASTSSGAGDVPRTRVRINGFGCGAFQTS